MSISNFSEKIKFLNMTEVNQHSVDLDEKGSLKRIEKRSFFANFVHWFIHLITCTRVPKNARLDEVTQQILKEAEDVYKSLNNHERKELTNALTKLEVIVENNGGAKFATIHTLALKIQNLDPVRKVSNSSKEEVEEEQENLPESVDMTVPSIPEMATSHDNQLQNLLRDLKARNIFDTDIAKEIGALLLQIKGSVDLSPEETDTLCRGLRNLSPEWLAQNAKNLSPQIIRFITEKSFQGDGHFISRLFEALVNEPVNKENLSAWVHALPSFKPEFLPQGTYFERLDDKSFIKNQLGIQDYDWGIAASDLIKSGKLAGKLLEENLSSSDVRIFLHNFFGFVAFKNYTSDASKEFDWAMNLIDQLNPQNRQFLLHTLCYARHSDTLVKVFRKSQFDEAVLQRILELNPSENEEKFFEFFIQNLLHDETNLSQFLSQIKEYIFNNSSRKEKLIFFLSAVLKVENVAQVPYEILKDIPVHSLIHLFRDISKIPNAEIRSNLPLIANALENRLTLSDTENLIREDYVACVALLPLLDTEMQTHFIIYVLKAISYAAYPRFYNTLLEAAARLSNEAWENASRQMEDLEYKNGIKSLPSKQLAAIVNGKANNKAFVRQVLENVFSTEDIQDQQQFIAFLKPEIFENENPRCIKAETWAQFFKAIGDTPNAHEKNLLVHAASLIFNNLIPNDIDYFLLSPEQVKLLPLSSYPIHVHLLLSYLSKSWNDDLEQIIQKMTSDQERSFLTFFKPIYEDQSNALLKLIHLLVEMHPQPHLLNVCVEILIRDIPSEKSCELLEELGTSVLEDYVIPIGSQLSNKQILVLKDRLDPQKFRQLMENGWDQLMARSAYFQQEIPYGYFLSLTDDAERMKQLLQAPFDPNYNSMQSVKPCLGSIFYNLERHPWKLFLVLEDEFTNKINGLKDWLVENDRYPKCKNYIDYYQTNKFSKESCEQINKEYQKFFNLTEDQKFDEACHVFDNMRHSAIGMLLLYTDLPVTEICDELPYLNDGQIFAVCRDPAYREKIQQALEYGESQNKLSGETISRIRKLLDEGTKHSIA